MDPFTLEADHPYRFEAVLYDQHLRQKWLVKQPAVANEDVDYFSDWLDALPGEIREFVVAFARLVIQAHEEVARAG